MGCHRAKPEPVTILFMDPGTRWLQRQHLSEKALRQFESETGIRVEHLPGPETSQEQLTLIDGEHSREFWLVPLIAGTSTEP